MNRAEAFFLLAIKQEAKEKNWNIHLTQSGSHLHKVQQNRTTLHHQPSLTHFNAAWSTLLPFRPHQRTVVVADRLRFDAVECISAADECAEDRVCAVKVWTRLESDIAERRQK